MGSFFDVIFDNAIIMLALLVLGSRIWRSIMKKSKESSTPTTPTGIPGTEPKRTRQAVPKIFEFLRELGLEEKEEEEEEKTVSPAKFFPADRQGFRRSGQKAGKKEQLPLRAEPAVVKKRPERPEKVRRQRTRTLSSATLFASRKDLSRGIVLAEVLGPPLSKRKNKPGVRSY